MRTFLAPNRIALYIGGAASLATAIAPAVADLDTTSTATLVSGLVGLIGIISVWLRGWQAYEARQEASLQVVETAALPPSVPTDVPKDQAAQTAAEQAIAGMPAPPRVAAAEVPGSGAGA